MSPKLRYIEPLPQKSVYHIAQSGINFNPEWPIRVNVNHILGDEEKLERIPAKIRKVKNLPLLFETVSTDSRRQEDSLENQMETYERLITGNPEYEFIGVFADQGLRAVNQLRRNSAHTGLLVRNDADTIRNILYVNNLLNNLV